MPEVVAVKLRFNPKTLWFAAEGTAPAEGDHVVVQTERGIEMGLAVSGPFDVTDEELRAPLKPVLRVATEEDLSTADSLALRGEEAMPIFRELINKYKLDMKPIDVEYLFGGDKAVFYFVSEERVDFRELVRDLAARFRLRVDMRQIGVRDEARMLGGIGHCGQQLCCSRFGTDFQPVSIRMAKEQDLPLNPLKISGLCGRLMCCLRHEVDAYKDFKSRAPKKGAIIETAVGLAKVDSLDTPREVINMRLEDGKRMSVPLSKMECGKGEGCNCPCKVSREALDDIGDPHVLLALAAIDRENEPDFTFEDAASAKPSRDKRRRDRDSSTERGKSAPKAAESASPAAAPSGAGDSEKPEGSRSKRGKRGGRNRGGRGGASKDGAQQSGSSDSQARDASKQPKREARPQDSGAPSGSQAPSERKRRRRSSGGSSPAQGSSENS